MFHRCNGFVNLMLDQDVRGKFRYEQYMESSPVDLLYAKNGMVWSCYLDVQRRPLLLSVLGHTLGPSQLRGPEKWVQASRRYCSAP